VPCLLLRCQTEIGAPECITAAFPGRRKCFQELYLWLNSSYGLNAIDPCVRTKIGAHEYKTAAIPGRKKSHLNTTSVPKSGRMKDSTPRRPRKSESDLREMGGIYQEVTT
jgi:hypothetical protein